MTAVAAIVDRQLAQAGENYVSAADKAAQKAAELQNRQMEIGRLLLPLQENGAVSSSLSSSVFRCGALDIGT